MFRLKECGKLKYYTIDEFEKSGMVKHCFTTKHGGVSSGEFSSMNLRMNCADSQENVLSNFKIICDEICVNFEDLVFSKQVHSDKIEIVEKKDCGNGIVKEQKFESADALITAERGVPIVIFGADCVPVFFLDIKERVIEAALSGWRGTVGRIAEKKTEKMMSEFSCKAENIIAAIGPSIQVCHFETGDDVAEIFCNEFGDSVLEKNEKYHVNMQKAIEIQLSEIGVKNIINSGICTYCRHNEFFSHRYTNGRRGVMAGIMELK